jgi:hypothetical protein
LLYKITFKSHLRQNKNKIKNKIFLKNIIMYLLLLKKFLQKCSLKILFFKKKNNVINILRAPYRYKTSFSQVFFEEFFIILIVKYMLGGKFFQNLKKKKLINLVEFFKKVTGDLGTNTLLKTNTKLTINFSLKNVLF